MPHTVSEDPLEDRLDRSSHVPCHPGLAVHGQDIAELRQSLRVPGRPRATREGFQLFVCQCVLCGLDTRTGLVVVSGGPLMETVVVYAGYFFGQYPCGWLIGRFPAQKVLAISILLWGLMVILLTQSRTYSSARKFTVARCLLASR